jgi:pimeloyl-ACP methyl ester carboxylesterase
MEPIIEFVNISEKPNFQVRIAKFSCLNEKYSHRHLILIPGWLSAIDNFTNMAKALQHYSHVILYEPRGFGKSITAHKKGHFSPDDYNSELSLLIKHLNLKDKDFIILGSCSGGSQVFYYMIEGDGPKPHTLIVFSPQEYYGTPFWLPVLGWIPTFIMNFVQKMIIVLYRLYLRIRGTGESANVTWAAERLKKNDDWSLRRFVIEFIHIYDIRGRQNEIMIPIQMFVSEKDHFVGPEKAEKFLVLKNSEVNKVKTKLHRVHEGKEDEIAKKINNFLEKLGK